VGLTEGSGWVGKKKFVLEPELSRDVIDDNESVDMIDIFVRVSLRNLILASVLERLSTSEFFP